MMPLRISCQNPNGEASSTIPRLFEVMRIVAHHGDVSRLHTHPFRKLPHHLAYLQMLFAEVKGVVHARE